MGILRRLFGGRQRQPPRDESLPATSPQREPPPSQPANLGALTEVRGVGEATVRNLEGAGFTSLETLAAADLDALLAVPGVGPTTAARVRAHARGEPAPELSSTPTPTDGHGQPNAAFNASRRIDRGIHEMLGLCRGVLADGLVSTEEALMLANWMESNPDLVSQWPASALAERLDRIFADGVVDADEQQEMADLLREIAGVVEEGEQAVGQSSTLPLDKPAPPLRFEGWEYVFTGRFASGTRRWCQQAVERLGAGTTSDVTLRTNALVIGTYGSRDWAHSSFGRKIQKAVQYRDERGAELVIVDEAHWNRFL